MRNGRKRICIDIPQEVYDLVKESCDRRMCTLTKYIIRALIEALKKEESYK
jgi:hypothetical protein